MAKPYNHTALEERWQHFWEEHALFQGSASQDCSTKEKIYLLFAFAYPSGAGLHVGHVESKTALDILARYYRMNGKAVFFPVGWDAFGLPAENYAVKTGVHPAETTKNAITTFRRQVKRVGISYDWEAEIATCHQEYYRWTQWIFLELFKAGLAYQALGAVNWCPSCQTVLANEQVVNGHCERCDSEVVQKQMKQWFFKITEYKDELISGLQQVDWPEATKQQQLNWIGKSEGVRVTFPAQNTPVKLTCFTTRIDTICGVTFLVISPEKFEELHLIEHVPAQQQTAVNDYLAASFKKTEEERKIGEKDKTGVATGIECLNPVTKQTVPLYVADYVLAGYGTGVVMGVPAHDDRDGAFAKKFGITLKTVVVKTGTQESAGTDYGTLVNSGAYNGLTSSDAQAKLVEGHPDDMERATTYKLRDWLISRQRYWGVPIPIVYDPEGVAHSVKDEHLPWLLPTDVEFKPTGESPLTFSKEFIERTERLYGKGWRPEFDTMDTFVDSSWYFLRYTDARNKEVFASKQQLQKWLPVDFYMIGPEHIVLHLLYSRFFTKFLRDRGYISFDEPFMKMRHQGMIMGPDGKKMSKSKGNVINPDDIIEKFGADTLRMYEMFMGPIEADKPWDVSAVAGVYRFLQRVQTRVTEGSEEGATTSAIALRQALHRTLKKVTDDIPQLKFNTAIASLMEFMNTWDQAVQANGATLSPQDKGMFVRILAPFCPFMAEELAHTMGTVQASESIHTQVWPEYDASFIAASEVTIGVQVNGKLRGELTLSAEMMASPEEIKKRAATVQSVQAWITNKKIVKEVVVPGKIVNFVTD